MSFGHDLRRFARAADDVDGDVIREVRGLVEDYVNRGLAAQHVEIMREAPVDDGRGLAVQGETGPNMSPSFSLRNANGNYTCQVARAYDCGQPLWVLDPYRGPLDEASSYADQWSQAADLPAYSPPVEDLHAKTSIMLPLRNGAEKIGVMCLDSVEAVELTSAATAELRLVAEALAVLYCNYDATANARTLRRTAIGELQQLIPESPQLTMPHVFVSSSSRAEGAVVDAIKSALDRDEFDGKFTWEHWMDNNEAGPVASALLEDIRRAKFGICYMSEPDEDGAETRYRDNLNVLFEAGMFHVLGEGGAWIPVREQDAPSPPFNLHDLNTVFVPRNEDGGLDAPEFEEKLSNFVRELID